MALALAGIVVAAGLAGLYGWWWTHGHVFEVGPRLVIILLILLNARQNLRQYRYAGVIAGTMGRDDGSAVSSGESGAARPTT